MNPTQLYYGLNPVTETKDTGRTTMTGEKIFVITHVDEHKNVDKKLMSETSKSILLSESPREYAEMARARNELIEKDILMVLSRYGVTVHEMSAVVEGVKDAVAAQKNHADFLKWDKDDLVYVPGITHEMDVMIDDVIAINNAYEKDKADQGVKDTVDESREATA